MGSPEKLIATERNYVGAFRYPFRDYGLLRQTVVRQIHQCSGAKILHLRCVEYARRFNVPIHVRSSFSQLEGTVVSGSIEDAEHQEKSMESPIIAGVAHDRSEAKITVVGVPDKSPLPALRTRPAGSVPAVTAKVIGAVPVVVTVSEKATPTVSSSGGVQVMLGTAATSIE